MNPLQVIAVYGRRYVVARVCGLQGYVAPLVAGGESESVDFDRLSSMATAKTIFAFREESDAKSACRLLSC